MANPKVQKVICRWQLSDNIAEIHKTFSRKTPYAVYFNEKPYALTDTEEKARLFLDGIIVGCKYNK